MKKQLTTDAQIWQALLAGKTIIESSVYGERHISLVDGNACYFESADCETDIARQVRKYYEVTE